MHDCVVNGEHKDGEGRVGGSIKATQEGFIV